MHELKHFRILSNIPLDNQFISTNRRRSLCAEYSQVINSTLLLGGFSLSLAANMEVRLPPILEKSALTGRYCKKQKLVWIKECMLMKK